jgi:hypothetical protein
MAGFTLLKVSNSGGDYLPFQDPLALLMDEKKYLFRVI